MKSTELRNNHTAIDAYVSPEVTIMHIAVEQGFAGSGKAPVWGDGETLED